MRLTNNMRLYALLLLRLRPVFLLHVTHELRESIGGEHDDSILLKESVIRGHHVFKNIWTPRLGEVLLVSQEPGNIHDR